MKGSSELVSLASKGRIEAASLTYWVMYLPECASILDEVLEAVRRGALEGTLVIADEVLGSPEGVLEYALILRPPTGGRLSTIIKLSMLTSIAKSIECLAGIEARVRWASDVVYDGRVLGKVTSKLPHTPYPSPPPVIVYSRINVNNDISTLGGEEASIKELVGPLSRSDLLESILKYFDRLYADIVSGKFRLIIPKIRKYLETIGRYVRVVTYSEGVIEGLAIDLDYDGALIIDCSGKLVSVYDEDILSFGTQT